MRVTIVALVLGCIAPLVVSQDSSAQSAYDYPWCAVYTKTSGAMSCYYVSFEQCMATMRGIGGTCVGNPYARADPAGRRDPAGPEPARCKQEARPCRSSC
jgi:hypothetical protein